MDLAVNWVYHVFLGILWFIFLIDTCYEWESAFSNFDVFTIQVITENILSISTLSTNNSWPQYHNIKYVVCHSYADLTESLLEEVPWSWKQYPKDWGSILQHTSHALRNKVLSPSVFYVHWIWDIYKNRDYVYYKHPITDRTTSQKISLLKLKIPQNCWGLKTYTTGIKERKIIDSEIDMY